MLNKLLTEKEIIDLDVDSPDRLAVHRLVLQRKTILRNVFREFHLKMMALDEKYFSKASGLRIEVGAGVYPVKETYPEVLATDVVESEGLDMIVDAQDMGLDDESVRAVYGQNCFHHFPDPSLFLGELERVLVPGGGAILIEPYHGPVASMLYRHLFASEGFDKNAESWKTDMTGPMNGANQALSYIVFSRDKEIFKDRHEELELIYDKPLDNYVRYFLSGGLNFKSLMPQFMEKPLQGLEFLLAPFSRWLALHHIVVIRRKAQ